MLPAKIVIDSIRNTAEIDYLRERFGYGFTLVGVLASQEDRWNRVQTSYTDRGLSQLEFNQVDIRDRNENLPYGQQVVDCVAAADAFLDNTVEHSVRSMRRCWRPLISSQVTFDALPVRQKS